MVADDERSLLALSRTIGRNHQSEVRRMAVDGRSPAWRTVPLDTNIILSAACERLGYCLSASTEAHILSDRPATPEAFADALLLAEGLDPRVVQATRRSELQEHVRHQW